MPIIVLCKACGFKLEIPDEFAGKKAKCGNCGDPFRVPGGEPAKPPSPMVRPLANASIDELVAELRRRGHSGMIALVDVSQYGVSSLQDLLDSGDHLGPGLTISTTEPLDAENQQRFLTVLADGVKRLADPAAAAEQDAYYEPFDLKGDALGMTLTEFKHKYARDVPGSPQPAPFCSDKAAGFRVPELMTEAWHHAARIVHARIEYPSEGRSPSLAGIETSLLLYQFIDGRLFQILALFEASGFPQVISTFRRKYGPPSQEGGERKRLVWTRMASTLEVVNGRISPAEPAQMRMYYDDLLSEALSRQPRSGGDI